MNVTGHHWWQVNIGSGNGLVPSGNKPLPEQMLTQIHGVTRPQWVNARLWQLQCISSGVTVFFHYIVSMSAVGLLVCGIIWTIYYICDCMYVMIISINASCILITSVFCYWIHSLCKILQWFINRILCRDRKYFFSFKWIWHRYAYPTPGPLFTRQ